MVIARYSEKYKADIEWLVKCFYEESLKEYGIALDFDVLSKTIEELKAQAFLLIKDDKCEGLLVGREVKTPINADRIWLEVIWYVSKEYRRYGVYLLKHARQLLKEEGFIAMVMICMESEKKDKLFRLYKRLGFKPMEHHFIGRL